MPRRLQKQILYGALYVIIFIALATGIYFRFVKPEATCFDTLLNQGEQGIDCGGPCAKICLPPNLQPIALEGQILVLQPDPDHQSLLALVKNPNFSHSAENFSYVLSLANASGTVVARFEGSLSLYAGESRYLLIPNFEALKFGTAKFEATQPTWISLAQSKPPPHLEIVNPKTSTRGDKIVIEGSVRNNEGIALPRVVIIGLIPGELGQVGGASQTEVMHIGPGEAKPFSIIHPTIEKLDVGAARLYPYGERP